MRALWTEKMQIPSYGNSALVARLKAEYPFSKDNDIKVSMVTQSYVRPIVHAIGDVKGKRILDLGCGSAISGESFYCPGDWSPWGCRALVELGADVTGVDLSPNHCEKFKWIQANLLKKDALKVIPDASIDLAYERCFFDSPLLARLFDNECQTWYEWQNHIVSQLERIVVPDGIFLHQNFIRSLDSTT